MWLEFFFKNVPCFIITSWNILKEKSAVLSLPFGIHCILCFHYKYCSTTTCILLSNACNNNQITFVIISANYEMALSSHFHIQMYFVFRHSLMKQPTCMTYWRVIQVFLHFWVFISRDAKHLFPVPHLWTIQYFSIISRFNIQTSYR
jgi:uncharacterized membrane protein YesL